MSNEPDFDFPDSMPCKECPAGVLHPRLITYFTWIGGDLITVPNFPAWICDVCGRREYDEQAISWLTMLLAPNAGKPTRAVHKPHHPRPQAGTSRPAPES
jgi:YgiT-type zinc finger domain-containing protein